MLESLGVSLEKVRAQVIEVLNRYLGEMSEAILDHGGTLVAYMGDGIMAVFGAPTAYGDDAEIAWPMQLLRDQESNDMIPAGLPYSALCQVSLRRLPPEPTGRPPCEWRLPRRRR